MRQPEVHALGLAARNEAPGNDSAARNYHTVRQGSSNTRASLLSNREESKRVSTGPGLGSQTRLRNQS